MTIEDQRKLSYLGTRRGDRGMHNRICPFCGNDLSRLIGTRVDIWVRCQNCRSIYRDITPGRFQQIHTEAFQDSEFINASVAHTGLAPSSALWDMLSLQGDSVLEIGPGSGHLLAAARQAGWTVEAVESSKVHRDYIRDRWDIDSVYAAMEEIPANRTFDAIVAINVFEHIYDITGFLSAAREKLVPGGTLFISTSNATSLEAAALGTWWPMYKVHDHVCFPSAAGMSAAARACGLHAERIWTAGYPFEFPVSALTALRDWSQARRNKITDHDQPPSATVSTSGNENMNPAFKSALSRFYRVAGPFDPTYRAIGALGRAGSLKARLTR